MSSVTFENAIRPVSEDTSMGAEAAGDGSRLAGEPGEDHADGGEIPAPDPDSSCPPDVQPASITVATAVSRSIDVAPDHIVPPSVRPSLTLLYPGPSNGSRSMPRTALPAVGVLPGADAVWWLPVPGTIGGDGTQCGT